MTMYKAMSTLAIKEVSKIGYNRTLNRDALESLDPDGTHVVKQLMLHEHKAGVLVEPHVRCDVWMKFLNVDEPLSAIIDIPMDVYLELPDVELVGS